MNCREAAELCAYVASTCPAQRFDERTAEAWFDLLGDLPFEVCKRAAQEVAKQQPFVAPSEIRRAADRMRVLTRRAVKRAMREGREMAFDVDVLIATGQAVFPGIDLLKPEDQETRFYNPPAAQIGGKS